MTSAARIRRAGKVEGPGRLAEEALQMPLPIPDVTSTATRGFAQEVTFLHGLSHVGPIGDPYGRTGPTNLWHKFGGATHTCVRSRTQNTKQKVRRRGQWLRHAAGSDELPDGPPPHAWVPARPMSNKSPGVTPRPWNWSPTAEPQRKVTSANKGDKRKQRVTSGEAAVRRVTRPRPSRPACGLRAASLRGRLADPR